MRISYNHISFAFNAISNNLVWFELSDTYSNYFFELIYRSKTTMQISKRQNKFQLYSISITMNKNEWSTYDRKCFTGMFGGL